MLAWTVPRETPGVYGPKGAAFTGATQWHGAGVTAGLMRCLFTITTQLYSLKHRTRVIVTGASQHLFLSLHARPRPHSIERLSANQRSNE